MNPLRGMLLAGSENAWLRDQAQRQPFVRRAVTRFMPGETLDDALSAAEALRGSGLSVILTHLGENVRDASEAGAVLHHYRTVFDRLGATELDAEVSVKLTQLGMDLDPKMARDYVVELAERAAADRRRLWVDMESSAYAESTLELFHTVQPAHRNVGIALQAYLHRTPQDLEALIAAGAAVRLVKGAYREPASIAIAAKRDVDAVFLKFALRLLDPDARQRGVHAVLGTHDLPLLARIFEHLEAHRLAKESCEVAMLYGIQRREQIRLAREGRPTRVLISYGASWFPWYMRRLAERPANMLFVLKNLGSG